MIKHTVKLLSVPAAEGGPFFESSAEYTPRVQPEPWNNGMIHISQRRSGGEQREVFITQHDLCLMNKAFVQTALVPLFTVEIGYESDSPTIGVWLTPRSVGGLVFPRTKMEAGYMANWMAALNYVHELFGRQEWVNEQRITEDGREIIMTATVTKNL